MKHLLILPLILIVVLRTEAATVSFPVPAGLRGYIIENGINNGPTGAADYRVGVQNGLEFRNYFGFAVPGFAGTLVGARLLLQASDNAFASPNSSETLALYSLPEIFGFNAIGPGTLYGSRGVSASDNGTTVAFELNAAALAAITPLSFFQLGGVVSTLAGSANQVLFRFSEGDTSILELDVNGAGAAAVPEQSTSLLLLSGAAAALWSRFGRKPLRR